jgi:pimeloyl-ACP methyl ester carboxylesterase
MNYLKSFDSEKIAYQFLNNPTNYQNTIVLVHGFGGDPNFLIPFVEKLAELTPQKRIISYNLRGHGYSTMKFPKEAQSFEETHAKDLQSLLEHLKIKNPILVGHSLGGIAVQEYLTKEFKPNPKKTIFISATTQTLGLSQIKKIFFEILKKLPISTTHPKEKSVDFHRQFSNNLDIDLKRFIHDTQISGGLVRWVVMMGSLLGWKNHNLSSLDKKSCYYIYGSKDLIVPASIQEKRLKKLKNINKILINSNHISPITSTEELAETVGKLL